jgi:hypothetical protein
MKITFRRSYYGTLDPNAVPPPALVQRAEEQQYMLHPDRTHEWAVTEPNYTWGRQLNGPIGWLVTFEPTPVDVDAIVARFEADSANPASDIQVLTSANAVEHAQFEQQVEADRRARGKANFLKGRR